MDLAAAAEALLTELCESHPMGYRPKILWKGYRVTAGIAYTRQGMIGLSAKVLRDEASLRETVIHEYAHLLAVHRTGPSGRGHGNPWKQAMQDLGATPKVRHNFEVERNQKRQRVTYECLRCGRVLERSRRLPARRRYLHSNCGGDIRLSAVERFTE